MRTLARTGTLARFALHRDRVRIAVWATSILLLVLVTASSTKGIYTTQADLDEAAAAARDNPAALAFNGPDQALDTVGGQVAFQIGAFGLTLVGLMTILMVSRLTRNEEENGRLELVRSMAVGADAPIAAALGVVTFMLVAIGAAVAVGLLAMDLPFAGSVVLGASFTALGLVFLGVTAVTVQVSENSRVASGLAGAVLGASFVLRAVGDTGGGALSWASPIGWAQKARPYAGERWWSLALCSVVAVALVWVAFMLAARRDVGAGLVAPRPGPAVAGPRLRDAFGLALRLQRATVLWWAVSLFALGAVYGSIADSIDDFVGDNDAMRDFLARSGTTSLTDSYLSTSLVMLAVIAGGFAVQSAYRARREETALHAEPLLATPTSRATWLGSHLAIALGGSVLVVAAAGAGTGLSYALVGGGAGEVPRLLGASLAFVPALWVFVGVTALAFGIAPRAALAAWAFLGWCAVVAFFGTLFELPRVLMDVSPFEVTPHLPVDSAQAIPIVALVVAAAVLVWMGTAAFRRRDLAP
jgi:ABC-2 type transport system permease protein